VLARILDTRTKRIAVAAVGFALLVGAVAVFALGGDDEEAAPTTTTTTSTTAPPTTTTVPVQVAPLTGLPGDYGDRLNLQAVFVKLDNAPQARPHCGIGQADIVFEEEVEGNITRLAAVFHSTEAGDIGPVRSTRSTDAGLVGLFGQPLYASSGGNGNVLNILHHSSAIDVGDNISGVGFWRQPGRTAPHNLFTTLANLYAKSPKRTAPPKPVFTYLSKNEVPPPSIARVAREVTLSFGGPQISRFVWDGPSHKWHRFHGATRHVDCAGKPVAPANVVALEINYEFSSTTGNSHPHGVTVGEGRATVFTAGRAIGGTWVRATPKSPLQLLDNKGAPIELTPGQTFVELAPVGGVSWH
jgi:hypothetical protein